MLLSAALRLTQQLFPHELGAADALGAVYEMLVEGKKHIDDFEATTYFIYTLEDRVIGASGVYRLIDMTPDTEHLLTELTPFLRNLTPSLGMDSSVAPFGCDGDDSLLDTDSLLWGGRLLIEPSSAKSGAVLPYIMNHIVTVARAEIERNRLIPVLLAFTQRDNNDAVRSFYENLGFVRTPAALNYLNLIQDVFALPLVEETPIERRLRRCLNRASQRARRVQNDVQGFRR
jgi:hypothetical protein